MPKAVKNMAFGTVGKRLKNDGLWETFIYNFLHKIIFYGGELSVLVYLIIDIACIDNLNLE